MGKPVRLTDSQVKHLTEYIEEEQRLADQTHEERRELWGRLDDVYYGNTPARMDPSWMSNFPILLGATFTDSVTARFMNTLFAYKPVHSAKPTRGGGWTKVVKAVEDYLEYQVTTQMKYHRTMSKVLFDVCRLGMGVCFHPWITEQRDYTHRVPLIGERTTKIVNYDFVRPQHIPLRSFHYAPGYSELHSLPWWGRDLAWTAPQIRERKRLGRYENLDDILQSMVPPTDDEREAAARAQMDVSGLYRARVKEYWLKYDVKEDGNIARYVVHFHPDTRKLLRVEEDTYPNWPLSIYTYGPHTYGLEGVGVVELTEPYDTALWALYNLLVDNFQVATLQTFKAKKGVGISHKTQMYPGKINFLSNLEDLEPMMMGSAVNLNPNFPRMIWELAERRAGISDYALGRESSSVQKSTATGVLALIQEGQRRYDWTISCIRDVGGDFAMFCMEMAHLRTRTQTPYMVMGERGAYVEQFLRMPAIPPFYGLSFTCGVSNAAMNKEIRKQDANQTIQLLERYYTGVIQMVGMVAQQPELQPMAMKMIQNAGRKVQQALEAFGELNPEQYTDLFQMEQPPMPSQEPQAPPADVPETGEEESHG